MRSEFAAIAVTVALMTACSSGDEAVPVAYTDETMTQFRPYAQGDYVIRSRAELQAAWAAAPFRVFPIGLLTSEPAFPAYDFQSSMLVGVSLGEGLWCHKPVIMNVLVAGDDMDVEYRVSTSSTLACLRNGPLISFALVPRATGTVTFRRIEG
jgi:hypothetical protein